MVIDQKKKKNTIRQLMNVKKAKKIYYLII